MVAAAGKAAIENSVANTTIEISVIEGICVGILPS
jgi:hypothetical protein